MFLPLSLHLFFPALPSVKADFMTTEKVANLTVGVGRKNPNAMSNGRERRGKPRKKK